MTQSIPETTAPTVDLDAIRAKAAAFDNARDDFQAAFNPATIEQARAELSAAAMESAATVPYLLDEIARLTGIVRDLLDAWQVGSVPAGQIERARALFATRGGAA